MWVYTELVYIHLFGANILIFNLNFFPLAVSKIYALYHNVAFSWRVSVTGLTQ